MSVRVNTIWNLLGAGVPLLLGIFAIPYLIHAMGVEAFGVLTLVWALIGYFSLFDFGLGRALTQNVSAVLAGGDLQDLPSILKSGLMFTALAGCIGGILFLLLAYPMAYHWLGVTNDLQLNAFYALMAAAIAIPLTTVTTGLRGALEGCEQFRSVNILRSLLGLANFGLPVLSVFFLGPSLFLMVLWLLLARALVMLLHLRILNQHLGKAWMLAQSNRKQFKKLFTFGFWMTISNVVSPLMVTADRFFISFVLGAGAVAFYTVPQEFLIRILIIPAAIAGALFPRITALLSSNAALANALYRKSLKIVLMILMPICVLIALGAHWGLIFWLGQEFADQSWLIVMILAFGILINGLAHIPFAMIQARGDARSTAMLHLLELLIYLPCLYCFLNIWGILGAAFAWTGRVFIDFIALIVVQRLKG